MKQPAKSEIEVAGRKIGKYHPTFFIADVAANHDGDLERAKALIYLAAEMGADAAKFQHFAAKTIVSDKGFKSLGKQLSHQAKWKKSVYEIYEDASLDLGWTSVLKETCDKAGIIFMTSPYSIELVDAVEPYLSAYKIGSGDIAWIEIEEYIAKKGKPVFLATGASTANEVDAAVQAILRHNNELVLMQCNTNYTASRENFRYINLNVLNTFRSRYPDMILGLSDHTLGHATALGAVALGARAIEKHFTDDMTREGPDHAFSMDPPSWKDMVERTRELEVALGDGVKKVEDNEKNTVVLQRRSIRLTGDLEEGTVLEKRHLEVLRPCPADGLLPYQMDRAIGRSLRRDMKAGEHIRWDDLT